MFSIGQKVSFPELCNGNGATLSGVIKAQMKGFAGIVYVIECAIKGYPQQVVRQGKFLKIVAK